MNRNPFCSTKQKISWIYSGLRLCRCRQTQLPPLYGIERNTSHGAVAVLCTWEGNRRHDVTLREIPPSAEAVLENSWRRFCFQRIVMHTAHWRFHDYALYKFKIHYILHYIILTVHYNFSYAVFFLSCIAFCCIVLFLAITLWWIKERLPISVVYPPVGLTT